MVNSKRFVSTSLRIKSLKDAAFGKLDAGAGQVAMVIGVLPVAMLEPAERWPASA